MLPFLFSANDRAKNRKRGNYAGDKSRMHLKSLREKSIRRGYAAQTATQFLQSKTQNLPSHGQELERSSAASESAGQLLKRLIVRELRDVVDGRDRDVQYGFSREKAW
jgi:hypothetical protein